MVKLYYATFEKGFGEIVKQVIKKSDKNSKIKTLYDDAVLFFASEHFCFKDSCFFDAFVVIQNVTKTGVGALNLTMKTILEKKDLKISLPKEATGFKFLIEKENENVAVDAKLKSALEVVLKKATKKSISYFAKEEIVLLSKKDGENLLLRRVQTADKFLKLITKFDIRPETAYLLNFMSKPETETVVEPFSSSGVISFVRANSFSKSNVIATEEDKDKVEKIKKLAKSLKEKSFSVMNYDFLDDSFPIKFIDKIVANLNNLGYAQTERTKKFFEKSYNLNVKSMVVLMPKNLDITRFIENKFEVENEIVSVRFVAFKLKIKA